MLDAAVFDQDVVGTAFAGLTAPRKTLPAKLFYDVEGVRLFEAITRLPEYYLTRTELSLLQDIAPLLVALAEPGSALVEYGASGEGKASLLLEAAGVCADFMAPLTLPDQIERRGRINFFPGSTIGNLEPDAARVSSVRHAGR